MPDFEYLQNPISKKWVVLAPSRAKRPNVAKGTAPVCPFCLGKEEEEQEVYRVGGVYPDKNWQVRVIPNKFPFAPIHEVIIHSPDHEKNFDQLPLVQIELILQTYRHRYSAHKDKGQVYIFHNRGISAGESLPHPHTQLVVVPKEVTMDVPKLDPMASPDFSPKPQSLGSNEEEMTKAEVVESIHFYLFCPKTSQWPDEVWIAPKKRAHTFGQISDDALNDLAFVLCRVIQIFDIRHGHEFPFNFYIYPGGDWYLRIIPRVKTIGGFELSTGIFVDTQDPSETLSFLKEHFFTPDEEKIKNEHMAEYHLAV